MFYPAFSSLRNFQNVLDLLKWPKVIVWEKLPMQSYVTFKESLKDIIFWQRPVEKTDQLLPISIMMEPLTIRFRYHFEGNRPTNRLDKVS
jgi:RAD50-interacting protein 1